MSLYIPGFDPQPVSVNIVGIGADSQTTYQVLPGQPTGTWSGQPPAFVGTGDISEPALSTMQRSLLVRLSSIYNYLVRDNVSQEANFTLLVP